MQRVIIDVPNLGNPQDVVNGSIASALITKAYKNGIFISENATNGDVIKAMFPNIPIDEDDFFVRKSRHDNTEYWKEWWNAPYKKESEERVNK